MFLHKSTNGFLYIKCLSLTKFIHKLSHDKNFTKIHLCTTENITKCLEAMKKAPQIKLSEDLASRKTSAVLIPICVHSNTGELSLLYTQRSSKIRKHIHEVSFPGGIREANDLTYEACALRETTEEIGIPSNRINIWGTGNLMIPSLKGPSIMPVIGMIDNFDKNMLTLNVDEVEKVFTVPLVKLCSDDCRKHTQFRKTYSLPVFVNIEERVWGITSGITHLFLSAFLPKEYYRRELKYITSYKVL